VESDAGWCDALQACTLGPITEKNEDRFTTQAESTERFEDDVPPLLERESTDPDEEHRRVTCARKQLASASRRSRSGAKCRNVDTEGHANYLGDTGRAQPIGLADPGYEGCVEGRKQCTYSRQQVRDDRV
jgi:hypothetical protein